VSGQIKTLEMKDGALLLLDQTELPLQVTVMTARNHLEVCDAIKRLCVRGAPAIGLAAAYGTVLAAQNLAGKGLTGEAFHERLESAMRDLQETRPTAVNLFWALERMRGVIAANRERPAGQIVETLRAEADHMLEEDDAANRRMGRFGAELVPDGANVLTHCNAGALATGSYGTALGVIRAAHEQGKRLHVWVDETRPLLQGARLTAWELQQLGIPYTLITDNMAGHFMSRREIDLVVVGADRIAANGDTANKIGTYSVAVLAGAHAIPFYVAAPFSTVDLARPSGDLICIEERAPDEVTGFRGVRTAPADAEAANPAFDVTPSRLIAAIITDRGVVRAPFLSGLAAAGAEASEVRTPRTTGV